VSGRLFQNAFAFELASTIRMVGPRNERARKARLERWVRVGRAVPREK